MNTASPAPAASVAAITLRQFKALPLNQIAAPLYVWKPYVILSKEGVVLHAGTVGDLRTLPEYYDECRVEVRKHDLHMNDNTRHPVAGEAAHGDQYSFTTTAQTPAGSFLNRGSGSLYPPICVATFSAEVTDEEKAKIVRACNSNAALIALLPYALSRIQDMHESGGDHDPLWLEASAKYQLAIKATTEGIG